MHRTTALAVLLLVPLIARAEINLGTSVDWRVVSSPHISILDVDGSGAVKTEILRGTPPEIPGIGGAVPLRRLYFFDAERKPTATIDLLNERRTEPVLTAEFQVLATEREILERVRARIARSAKETVNGSFKVEVPTDTPAFRALYAGSSCYLVVPADPELRAGLVEQLRAVDVAVRARAAWRLSRYPGEETVAALKAALADPGTVVVRTHDGERTTDVTTWPVRQNAYDALVVLKVEVAKPEGWRAEDARHWFD